MNQHQPSPADIIDGYIESDRPFAIIKKEHTNEAFILSGDVSSLETLNDIPRKKDGNPVQEFRYDTLSMIPFAQAKEIGMDVIDDGTPIRCMNITEQTRFAIADVLSALPRETIECEHSPKLSKTEEEFADDVRLIIRDQIRKGKACTVVLSIEISAKIKEMSPKKALTILNNLLRNEFGAYLTFFFYDGQQYFIGASPERHITVDRGEVTMNPISGTYRKVDFRIDPDAFEDFLRDPKEINELFMCLDEEMKQMAQMCEEGGRIVGPLLKEMSGVVHTEYLLVGKSGKDCIDLLHTSMHPPTVTGSPIEEAFRIIKSTEKEPRAYYAGEIVLIGQHPDGAEFLDSAIAIRTMRILPNGLVTMRVGASIVRDSIPENEAKEVIAKAGGALRALQPSSHVPIGPQLPNIMNDRLEALLHARNEYLNAFLMNDQKETNTTIPELAGKTVTIIDFEDQFDYVIRHMANAMGAKANVVRFDEFDVAADVSDIVIVGPGPGDPRDESDPKMRVLGNVTSALLAGDRRFLSVCLGHQKLCESLGIDVRCKDDPSQGVQRDVDLFGANEKLGFYNAYAGFVSGPINGIDVAGDPDTGEVHAIRGKRFSGFQFHPESIMSQNGFKILANELKRLISA